MKMPFARCCVASQLTLFYRGAYPHHPTGWEELCGSFFYSVTVVTNNRISDLSVESGQIRRPISIHAPDRKQGHDRVTGREKSALVSIRLPSDRDQIYVFIRCGANADGDRSLLNESLNAAVNGESTVRYWHRYAKNSPSLAAR